MMLYAVMLMVCVVLFNHMGLKDAVEDVTHYKFKILSCAKCGTFWSVLIFMLLRHHPITSITVAFALSYMAIWFELLLGFLSKVYEDTYDKIQTTQTHTDEGDAESEMPQV